MKPQYWTILGLCADIVGAFCVSVEAIRLENLKRLRERVFLPVHRSVLPIKIVFVDDETPLLDQKPLANDEVEFGRAIALFLLTHTATGIVGLLILFRAFRLLDIDLVGPVVHWWLMRGLAAKILLLAAGIPVLSLVLLAIGEGGHQLAIFLTLAPVTILEAIERRTPNGTIGIIGFLLLLLGFVLQIVGTSLGIP